MDASQAIDASSMVKWNIPCKYTAKLERIVKQSQKKAHYSVPKTLEVE